jgi:transposase
VSTPGPREGGPRRRRAFTARDKLDHLTGLDAASQDGGGGVHLREQGIYSSQITEWRNSATAGCWAGKRPDEKIGRPTAEQAEIARLSRELEVSRRKLARTQAALRIPGRVTRSWRSSGMAWK